MTEICLGFEVHQPFRLNRRFTEEMARGKSPSELLDIYFDNSMNREIFLRVARKCYLPATGIILENIDRYRRDRKKFKVAFSLSGTFLEQCMRWAPELLDIFTDVAKTGCAEFLCQTYYHSLSSIFSSDRTEFVEQVQMHRRKVEELFGMRPTVFENTEFLYNNSIASTIAAMGFRGIFTEGAERILGWRSPNFVYRASSADIKVLLRNYRLSDDVAFRFSNRDWEGWPLTADRYAYWLACTPGTCINIFMDYETMGEHQWPETGIHEFLRWLPGEILRHENLEFSTPSELLRHEPVGEIDVHDFATVSWADAERSTNAWLGNDMQRTAFNHLKALESWVRKAGDPELTRIWRLLQTSDLIYYMFVTPGPSGLVHGYFSQQFPSEAFWVFMRVLSDFYTKVSERLGSLGRPLRLLRPVPPDRAFHFFEGGRYINLSAHSLRELADVVRIAPESSLREHLVNGDIRRWVEETIEDRELAARLGKRGLENLRGELVRELELRLNELEKVNSYNFSNSSGKNRRDSGD
jgi:alpha-amylase